MYLIVKTRLKISRRYVSSLEMPIELPTPPTKDGLPCSEVGSWAEDKYKLLWLYDTLFSTGIKNKWDCRVYLDLFSGPGIVRVRDSNKLTCSSPLLALSVQDKFDKYIFCETNGKYLDALRRRIDLHFPKKLSRL